MAVKSQTSNTENYSASWNWTICLKNATKPVRTPYKIEMRYSYILQTRKYHWWPIISTVDKVDDDIWVANEPIQTHASLNYTDWIKARLWLKQQLVLIWLSSRTVTEFTSQLTWVPWLRQPRNNPCNFALVRKHCCICNSLHIESLAMWASTSHPYLSIDPSMTLRISSWNRRVGVLGYKIGFAVFELWRWKTSAALIATNAQIVNTWNRSCPIWDAISPSIHPVLLKIKDST